MLFDHAGQVVGLQVSEGGSEGVRGGSGSGSGSVPCGAVPLCHSLVAVSSTCLYIYVCSLLLAYHGVMCCVLCVVWCVSE
jgi:hypothetical protein